MPGLRPIVEGIDTVLMLTESIAASELFTVSDPDGDPITQYVFTDSGNPSSGFFVFQGIIQNNGVTLTIDADQLDQLFYVAGPVVGNETIRVRASDGTLLSDPGLVKIYSARTESVSPVAVVDNATVLGNETILASSFISAFDPDGFPIVSYMIRDRNDDRSFFSLDGEAVTQGEYRTYSADEFERLVYNGVGRRTENIDVFAFDGSTNSLFSTGEVTVLANLNRPVVDFASAISQESLLSPILDYVSYSDSDGNTIKTVELKDRNRKSFSGNLIFEGEALDPGVFHSFTLDELDNVFFQGGERNIVEQVRIRVLDGRFRSAINTIEFTNIAGGNGGPGGGGGAGVPELEVDNFGSNVQEQLFFQDATDLITQVDGGFPGTTFEILDTNANPVSSAFYLNGQQLDGDVVHSLTADEFESLQIRTGTFEDRHFDELYVRTSNGTFFSDWARLNMMTEPEYFEAFSELTPLGNEVATWDDFITPQGNDPLEITFSFMQQLPNYNTGEALEEPGRNPTPRLFIPFTDAQREWTRYLFNHIETFANVNFVEVVDSPLVVDPVSGNRGGTIRLANYYRALDPDFGGLDPSDDSITCNQVFGPQIAPEGGDVWINADIGSPAISPCFPLDFLFSEDLGPGSFEYETMLNSINTAIGQGTPFDVVGGGDQNPILPDETAIDQFTVQGLFTDPAALTGYQLYDVNYFQEVYRPNNNHNTGDDVYSVDSNLNNGADSRETIWDAAGNDTLSGAGSAGSVTVDLRPGFFSSIGNLANNISIAFTAQIENAIGGDGNDTLIGNELNNEIIGGNGADTLRGNGGNDFFTGGAGGDTFVFTIGDGDNTINEMQLAGRDTIQFLELAGLDNFEEDFTFRLDGRDLVIQLTLDGEAVSDTTVTIKDQTRGAFRIETLNIGDQFVDLQNLTTQATGANQKFQLTEESTIFGNLVAPV